MYFLTIECEPEIIIDEYLEPEIELEQTTVRRKFNKSQSEEQEHKLFKCSICDKNYGTKYSLKEHIGVVHEGKKYKCDECNEIFSWKSGLNSLVKSRICNSTTFHPEKSFTSRSQRLFFSLEMSFPL